jgi:formylglycine-generating enzyme required for sulfatase activity
MRPLRLFIASSADVADECAAVESVVTRLNDTLGQQQGFVVHPFRWNRHAPAGVARDAGRVQDLLNPRLDAADIVVIIVWNRVGDGLLEEYERALGRFRADGSPRLMPYSCRREFDFVDSDAAIAKAGALQFIKRLQADGGLPVEFKQLESFRARVHDDLTKVISELVPQPASAITAAQAAPAPDAGAGKLTDAGRTAYLTWVEERWGKLTLSGLLTDKVAPAVSVNDVYVSPLATRPDLKPPSGRGPAPPEEGTGELLRALANAKATEGASLPKPLAKAIQNALVGIGVAPAHAKDANALRRVCDRLRRLGPDPEPSSVQHVLRTVDMEDVLRPGARVLVEGAPGSGKTTVLKHIAVSACHALSGSPKHAATSGSAAALAPLPLPAFTELRRFATWLRSHRADRLDGDARHLDHYLVETLEPPSHESGWVLPGLKRGDFLLLFDGLDEIPDATLRAEVAAILGSFVRQHGGCTYVVTSRPSALSDEVRVALGRLAHSQILPLDPEHMSAFLRAWYGALYGDPTTAAERAEALMQRLLSRERLLSLADTPILLTAIAIVHKTLGDLPERRAELFEHCVKAMLHRWDASRDTDSQALLCGPLDIDTKLAIVEEIAWRIHCGGEDSRSLELDPLVALITPLLPAQDGGRPPGKEACAALIDALAERSGLLVPAAGGGYEFPHLTFQEFLAARRACDRSVDLIGDLSEHLHESWWREVIALAPAFKAINGKTDAATLLRGLSDRAQALDGPERGAALAAVGIALTDLRELPIPGLLQLVEDSTRRMAAVVRDRHARLHVRDRLAIGESLGWLGDPRLTDDARWIEVPAGQWWRGAVVGDDEAHEDEMPGSSQHSANAFHIQRWPVTRDEFGAFLHAGGYDDKTLWDPLGWRWQQASLRSRPDAWTAQLSGAPNSPVTGVSWWESAAYCRWLTNNPPSGAPNGSVVRLPTEAEWERAARGPNAGGEDGLVWAWGRDWEAGIANTRELGVLHPSPVGIFPAAELDGGPWDVSGNVWEWCLDWFDPEAYRREPSASWVARTDRIRKYRLYTLEEGGEVHGHGRVVRGGGWADGRRCARVSYRFRHAPIVQLDDLGFRCAASPLPLGFGARP